MATYCQIEVNTKEIKQMIEMCTQQYRAVFFWLIISMRIIKTWNIGKASEYRNIFVKPYDNML